LNYQYRYTTYPEKPSILVILSEYYGLTPKLRGNRAVSLCPFNGEDTPSFTVWPGQNRAYCFGCRWSGDSWDLLAEATGKTVKEVWRVNGQRFPRRRFKQRPDEREGCLTRLYWLLGNINRIWQDLGRLPSDKNLLILADVFYLEEYIVGLIDRLESSEEDTRAVKEARERGLFNGKSIYS